MSYRNQIVSWHAKAQEDYFSSFMFEYLAFIAYLNSELFNSERDRESIQKLKQHEELKQRYLSKIDSEEELRSSWLKIKEELNKQALVNTSRGEVQEPKWWNCSADADQNPREVGEDREAGVIHSHEDWVNMVEYWYTVRNNLFHGTKGPQNGRNRRLIEHGFKTLKPLVDVFVEDLTEDDSTSNLREDS